MSPAHHDPDLVALARAALAVVALEQDAATLGSNGGDALESWHRQYNATDSISSADAVVQAVRSDELDSDQIETEVQRLVPAADVAQGICGKCRHLLDHWPTVSTWEARADARAVHTHEVEAAARAGCRFCAFLMSRLELECLLEIFRKIEVRLRRRGDGRTASLAIAGHPGSTNMQWLWLNLPGKTATDKLTLGEGKACVFASWPMSPRASLWNEPVAPLAIASMWLARCADGHKDCRIGMLRRTKMLRRIKTLCRTRLGSLHRPPSRLVSVGHGAVKLVITEDLQITPRYATLSYCWGREPFTMLTPQNLESFLDHIPQEILPRTFNDAIHAARRLGLEYVWIDALCIIQGEVHNSDWEKEAGHMKSVYSGAFVNLAASTATSVHHGFLRPRKYRGGFLARVTAGTYSTVHSFYSPSAYREATELTHLAGRAWTLQERLLPARTIYFSDEGLFWECRSHSASEFLPDGLPEIFGSSLLCPEGRPWPWSEIVQIYSGADLTHGSDRLPALSGIAQRQHQATGDLYLAGLWRRPLVKQLMWEVSGRRTPRPTWRAPTWSWASVDGRSLFRWAWPGEDGLQVRREYARVHDAWTTPSGPDRHGAVAGGELALLCSHVVRARTGAAGGDPEDPACAAVRFEPGRGTDAFRAHVPMDCLEDAPGGGADGVVHLLPLVGGFEIMTHELDEETSRYDTPPVVRGLVLRACGDPTGRFRRVGCFKFVGRLGRGRQGAFEAFMDILEKKGASKADPDPAVAGSVIKDRKWRYKITIE